MKIQFSEDSCDFVAEALEYEKNDNGFLTKDGALVLATDGKPIMSKEVAIFSKSGIVRDDLLSLIDFVDKN